MTPPAAGSVRRMPRGELTRYTYDQSGRMMEKQLPDGQRVTYQYDQFGNLLQADDGVFPIKFSYDAAGRLMRVAYPAIQQAVGYEYDALGLRTKLIDPQGRETRYEYNALKQLGGDRLAGWQALCPHV